MGGLGMRCEGGPGVKGSHVWCGGTLGHLKHDSIPPPPHTHTHIHMHTQAGLTKQFAATALTMLA